MAIADLKQTVEAAWEARDQIGPSTKGDYRTAVDTSLSQLDKGEARVAEKKDGDWVVNEWLKKAVLLSFRLNDNWNHVVAHDTGHTIGWDKVPLKFADWGDKDFRAAGFRA